MNNSILVKLNTDIRRIGFPEPMAGFEACASVVSLLV